jgi:hypothetical protein
MDDPFPKKVKAAFTVAARFPGLVWGRGDQDEGSERKRSRTPTVGCHGGEHPFPKDCAMKTAYQKVGLEHPTYQPRLAGLTPEGTRRNGQRETS